MSYSVIRMQKIKAGGIRGIQNHDQRLKESHTNPDIDKAKSHLNQDIHNPDDKRTYYMRIKDRVKELDLPKAPRKDAVVMCEFIATSDKAFFDRLSQSEQERFFKESYNFIANRYGKENIVHATVHYDEKTPHLHMGIVPVTKDNKLSCYKIFDKTELTRLQADYNKYMNDKGFELEKGESREGKRKHLDTQRFKAETMKEEIKGLEYQIDTLKNDLKDFKRVYKSVRDIKYTYQQIDGLKGKKSVLNKANVVVPEKDFEMLKNAAKKSATLEYELELIKSEVDRLKDRSKRNEAVAYKYKTENEQLRDKVSELSEKITVFYRLFAKHNVSEKQVNALLKQTMKEMQAEKIQQRSKQKSWEMER